MKKYMDDILAILGAVSITTGAFFIHKSIGFIVMGLAFIASAYIYQRGKAGEEI